MAVKVASPCLHWSQTLASSISSPSAKRRSSSTLCRYTHTLDCSALFGNQNSNLYKSQSLQLPKQRNQTMITRASTASLDSFSDEEFSRKIEELALKFQLSDDDEEEEEEEDSNTQIESPDPHHEIGINSLKNAQFDPLEPPDWPGRDGMIPASIEMKANSVELPVSLRMIKKKKQWQDGFRKAGESAYCSMKKAFSNMVFIIRELQSYTLHMRELLYYEDLQGILIRVQREMHASFVWLFEQVFSHTPTLMVYVMILLANYSVYSMSSNPAIAATSPMQALTEELSVVEDQDSSRQKFGASSIKTFSVSSSSGKSTSIGGSNGGGGYRSVGSGMDGDGRFDEPLSFVLDGLSSIENPTRTSGEESVSGQATRDEEMKLWNSMVEEASRMRVASNDEALDHETMQKFVAPVFAKIETDDHQDYFRTELLYQAGLAQEPDNALLLANYAQFLYLVIQDHVRAEEYFKKAANVEPKDAEALNKYATFLWKAKNDLWAAEETYLDAISAEPENSYYAANYAHFLWNTGGEDTCFPLESPDTDADV